MPMDLRKRLMRHRTKFAVALVLLAAVAWLAYAHRDDLSREALTTWGKSLPATWFIAAFFVLPLLGFPVSVFLVLAGIRFGLGGGMAVTAAAVIIHHFGAYRLAHGFFRDRVRHRLEHAGYAIPPIKENHRAWFTALFAALHGPPYIAKIYLVSLTDIPFRIFFWVGVPIYIFFCLVPVAAGSAVMDFNPAWIYGLGALTVVLIVGGYFLKRRFGSQMANDDGAQ